jgi:hypothetical protein
MLYGHWDKVHEVDRTALFGVRHGLTVVTPDQLPWGPNNSTVTVSLQAHCASLNGCGLACSWHASGFPYAQQAVCEFYLFRRKGQSSTGVVEIGKSRQRCCPHICKAGVGIELPGCWLHCICCAPCRRGYWTMCTSGMPGWPTTWAMRWEKRCVGQGSCMHLESLASYLHTALFFLVGFLMSP